MTSCQHIIKSASEIKLLCCLDAYLTIEASGKDRREKELLDKVEVFLSRLCTLSKGYNEYNVLTFVI